MAISWNAPSIAKGDCCGQLHLRGGPLSSVGLPARTERMSLAMTFDFLIFLWLNLWHAFPT